MPSRILILIRIRIRIRILIRIRIRIVFPILLGDLRPAPPGHLTARHAVRQPR